MIKIGHISDIHWLDTTGAHVSDFLNKRISGGINLIAGRAHIHSKDTAKKALETLKSLECSHLIVTGDLTNLALPAEFLSVKTELNRFFDDSQMTIVPGNHDFYTRESAKHKRFESMIYTQKPGNLDTGIDSTWPFVRIIKNIAIIGLNSAQPRPWFVAAGKLGTKQLDDLQKILQHPDVVSKIKIVALHHHLTQVVTSPGESLRNLKERAEFLRICQQAHVELIVHGHNHDFTLCRAQNLIVSETGSCSVCSFKRDNRAGKFNLYHFNEEHLVKIETYRFENEQFSLWKTWDPKDLPEFPTPSPLVSK